MQQQTTCALAAQWPAVACRGLPWPAVACRGLPWPAVSWLATCPVLAQVAAQMGFGMTEEEVANAKVDKYIVNRAKAVLDQLKQCRTEEERVDYHTISAALAPTRESARDPAGMIRKVAARLDLERGARYNKKTGERRPYVFDQAITRREAFDEGLMSRKLAAGDKATSRGQLCTVIEIDHEADTCKLGFSLRGIEAVRTYSCIYKGVNAPGKAPFPKGSARLRPAPPSLRPKPRETRCNEIAEAARPGVEEAV